MAELGARLTAAGDSLYGSCPVCRGRDLRIYPDRALGGHWYACGGCGLVGDGVELAARAWNLTPTQAAVRLSAAGACRADGSQLCDATQAADNERITSRHQATIDAFWADASARNPAIARDLLVRANLADAARRPDWPGGMGRFVGVATRDAVERACLAEGRIVKRARRPAGVGSGSRANQPHGEYLVLAHRDVPGRICGFTLIMRQGQFPDDVLYISAHHPSLQRSPDYGLAFFEAAAHVPQPDRACVYVGDPLVIVRVQGAHHAATGRPAPLALAWCAGATSSTTAAGILVEPTVLAPTMLANEAERLARQLRGRVCLDPTFSGGPAGFYEMHERSRQPGTLPSPRPAGATRLPAVPLPPPPRAEARLPDLIVHERDGAWFEPDGTPLSDATVVIDQVVRFATAHHTSYRCSVHYCGQRIAVTIPAAATPEKALDRIRRACVDAGVGRPMFARKAARLVLEISRKLHEPRHVDGCEDMGYDPASGLVRMQRFSLDRDGHSQPPVPCLPFLPGANVPPPTNLSMRELRPYLESHEAGLVLTILSWAAATLLEAATGTPVPRLGVIGEAAGAYVKATLEALGVGEQATRPWPRWVNAIPCRSPYASAIPIWTQDVPMFSLAAGWAIVDGLAIRSAADRSPVVTSAPALFSGFLQRLAAKGFTVPGASRPVTTVRALLRAWLTDLTDVNPTSLDKADLAYIEDDAEARPHRAAAILRDAYDLWSGVAVEEVDGRAVVPLPAAAAGDLVARKRTPTPGADAFLELLLQSGAVVSVRGDQWLACANWLYRERLYDRRRPGLPGARRKLSRNSRSFSQP